MVAIYTAAVASSVAYTAAAAFVGLVLVCWVPKLSSSTSRTMKEKLMFWFTTKRRDWKFINNGSNSRVIWLSSGNNEVDDFCTNSFKYTRINSSTSSSSE